MIIINNNYNNNNNNNYCELADRLEILSLDMVINNKT